MSRHNVEASHTILTKSFCIQKPSASHKIQRKRTWINTWFYIKSIIIIIINQKQKYYAWNPAPFEILNIFILGILKPKLHRNNQDCFFWCILALWQGKGVILNYNEPKGATQLLNMSPLPPSRKRIILKVNCWNCY